MFPRPIRFLLARDTKLLARVLSLFVRTLFCWPRRAARKDGFARVPPGAVSFLQHFGSAIKRLRRRWGRARSASSSWRRRRKRWKRLELSLTENYPSPGLIFREMNPGRGSDRGIAAQRRAEGRGILGRRNVLQQSPFDSPQTVEPRRQISPRVASLNRWARVEALQRLRSFIDDYRRAWQAFRQGLRDVLFPFGTYQLRFYVGVACASSA